MRDKRQNRKKAERVELESAGKNGIFGQEARRLVTEKEAESQIS